MKATWGRDCVTVFTDQWQMMKVFINFSLNQWKLCGGGTVSDWPMTNGGLFITFQLNQWKLFWGRNICWINQWQTRRMFVTFWLNQWQQVEAGLSVWPVTNRECLFVNISLNKLQWFGAGPSVWLTNDKHWLIIKFQLNRESLFGGETICLTDQWQIMNLQTQPMKAILGREYLSN